MKAHFQFKSLPLAVAIASVMTSPMTYADELEGYENITVSATKMERDINEIAANVTTIDAERVDAIAANNIRDLLRYEPGVTVEGSGRFGLSDINIRGINGDRVLIVLDNVPVADGFSFGPNLSARRDFIDIDLIKQVEVIRGPASTLYGSDAIGGVVSFISKDPSDLVDEGERFAGRVKLGYVSASGESFVNGQLAGVAKEWQWLVNAGYRDTSETETFFDSDAVGAEQQSANPQDGSVENALVKLIWTPSDTHRFTFVGETFRSDSQTEVTSDVGAISRGVLTQESRGDDERERERFSMQYRYQPKSGSEVDSALLQSLIDAGLHRFSFDAYSQSSETVQHTELVRMRLGDVPLSMFRTRDSYFEQDTQGVLAQADFVFGEEVAHYLIWGAEWQKTDSKALREGMTQALPSGQMLPEFSVFPARDFPISELKEFALYVQDEIQFFEGAFTLSPGLRYDDFSLTPESDALFAAANPGVEIAGYDDNELSAKLGAVYDVSEDASVWLQWAQGFRIPPMDDVNVGFTNFAGGYTSLSNPNLQPERVDSYEIGFRQRIAGFSWAISAYVNQYEDFIESLALKGFNPQTNLLEFQARNIDDVEIKGVDLSADWQIDQWHLRLATSWQNSEDKATGEELESVLPTQTVVGIQYGAMDDPWRVELVGTHTREANVVEAGEGEPQAFVAPSATYIDLLAHYQVTDNVRINAGIFNITDKQYWFASEVRGRTVGENLDRFTAPGRNVSINAVVTF